MCDKDVLTPHLFNIYSEVIMKNALEGVEGTVKIGRRSITNLRYADDFVLVSGSMEELQNTNSKQGPRS